MSTRGHADMPSEFDATADLPEGTLLLEASAGTGKTYTIASLVLRAVAELGIDLDRVLVVTFTRAAAAELRSRIRGRLTAALTAITQAAASVAEGEQPDVASLADGDAIIAHLIVDVSADELAARARRVRKATEDFDQATIDTIHGFCRATLQRTVPDVAIELGLDLVEDVTELVDELAHDALVRELRDADVAWFEMFKREGIGTATLRELAWQVEAEPQLEITPVYDDLDVDPQQRWIERLEGFAQAWIEQRDQLESWVISNITDKNVYKGKNLTNRLTKVDEWCDGERRDVSGIEKAVEWFSRAKLTRYAAGASIPENLDVVDRVEPLQGAAAEAVGRVLARFARTVRDELPRRKSRHAVMSFGDLLTRLADALDDDATAGMVRASIRSRYEMALIDEFQDTDAIQWRIFERVFDGDARLQLIGDPKQAIYAFRGADINTYRRVAEAIPAARRYTLTTNFRSDARYVDAVGALFGREELEPMGAFADRQIRHVPVRAAPTHRDDRLRFDDDPRPRLEIRYVPRTLVAKEQGGEPPSKITKGWAEPRVTQMVTSEIVELLGSPPMLHYADQTPRLVTPGDLAVLVQTNRQASRIQAALLDAGVPAVVESDASVLGSPEATELQRLLDALLAPSSEGKVRPALLGPWLGVTAHDLDRAESLDWDRWADDLASWAAIWREKGIAVALRQIMQERASAANGLRRLRGERTVTNLLHLRELLHGAERSEQLGPAALAAWLRDQRHREHEKEEDRELRLESDADAVSVATIHRSKGLQYGLVWCPFLWEVPTLQGEGKKVVRYRDPKTHQRALHVSGKGNDRALAERIATQEMWEERHRLLYVALTRAMHRCVVYTGPFNDFGSSPLARLLHAADRSEDGKPTLDVEQQTDDQLIAELETLRSDDVGITVVEEIPPAQRWQPRSVVDSELHVRSFERDLDRCWQRTSFSRLTAATMLAETDQPDDDPDVVSIDPSVEIDEDPTPSQLATFPRGTDAGTFLHTVIEQLDFQADQDQTVASITKVRDTSAFGRGDPDMPSSEELARTFEAIFRTPFGPRFDDLTLATIGREDRLDELSFDLPLAGGYDPTGSMTLHQIADVAEAHADTSPLPLLEFAKRLRSRQSRAVRGFLTGSIDLVARDPAGRFLLADYKSNWLGRGDRSTVEDYHPSRLAEAMLEHDYLLQASLYLVALHRYLRARVGPTFDPDRDVLGCVYLFLRGMVGPRTPQAFDGTPYGVYVVAPPLAYVEDLDAVLRGERR